MFISEKLRRCAETFASEAGKCLGDRALSVYLYGSVVLGDYREGWSDIDMICFSSEPIGAEAAEELLMLRQALVSACGEPLYRKIEGAAVCGEEFSAGRYRRLVYWGTSGQRITDRYCFDCFSMWELLRCGVLLRGQDIRERMTLPTYPELVSGVRGHYETIRTYAKETDESVYSCGWLLDIARCLYTLRYGEVIGKTAAGEWAVKERLCPDVCLTDMERTLAIRKAPSAYLGRDETKAWLRTLGKSVQTFADVLEKELQTTGNFPSAML